MSPIIPIVRFEGVIQTGERSLCLRNVERVLERAFKVSGPAVALVINSPGGSAAQSHLIMKRVRDLAKLKNKKVLTFVEDAGASGGYILACAGDEIYVDRFSIVGSVGVIAASFGFTEAIKKIGVERRMNTAGKNKSLMDPFSPFKQEDKERLQRQLDLMHLEFKLLVRERRDGKLKGTDEELFEGDFYIGKKAVDLGFVDGLGDAYTVIREKYGKRIYTPVVNPLRFSLFGAGIGMSSRVMANTMDEVRSRVMWERIGM